MWNGNKERPRETRTYFNPESLFFALATIAVRKKANRVAIPIIKTTNTKRNRGPSTRRSRRIDLCPLTSQAVDKLEAIVCMSCLG
jgi:hypothetical protein